MKKCNHLKYFICLGLFCNLNSFASSMPFQKDIVTIKLINGIKLDAPLEISHISKHSIKLFNGTTVETQFIKEIDYIDSNGTLLSKKGFQVEMFKGGDGSGGG